MSEKSVRLQSSRWRTTVEMPEMEAIITATNATRWPPQTLSAPIDLYGSAGGITWSVNKTTTAQATARQKIAIDRQMRTTLTGVTSNENGTDCQAVTWT